MPLHIYHVYIDYDDQSIRAVKLGESNPALAKLTQSLWNIQAENKDDALERSVTGGLVDILIDDTEKKLQEQKDFVTARHNNPFDATVFNMHGTIAQTYTRLSHFKDTRTIYTVTS